MGWGRCLGTWEACATETWNSQSLVETHGVGFPFTFLASCSRAPGVSAWFSFTPRSSHSDGAVPPLLSFRASGEWGPRPRPTVGGVLKSRQLPGGGVLHSPRSGEIQGGSSIRGLRADIPRCRSCLPGLLALPRWEGCLSSLYLHLPARERGPYWLA